MHDSWLLDNPVDNENISKESQSTSAMHCSGVFQQIG